MSRGVQSSPEPRPLDAKGVHSPIHDRARPIAPAYEAMARMGLPMLVELDTPPESPSMPREHFSPAAAVVSPSTIVRFEPSKLKVGALLGKGAFCEVCVVTSSLLGDQRAVLKRVRSDIIDEQRKKMAHRDLAHESALFARMAPHPHIVRVLGMHADGDRIDYLVLEHIYESFATVYDRWQRHRGMLCCSLETAESIGKLCCGAAPGASSWRRLWASRLRAARDLASALAHLHTTAVPGFRVAYRDLKPANLGFDYGRLVLYDFGLAKLIPKPSAVVMGDFASLRMSAETGSPRYMAPEVALAKHYDEGCDVYSFGMLLWQLCALALPFAAYSGAAFHARVVVGGERLPLPAQWPQRISRLINRCWAENPASRPTCDAAVVELEEQITTFSLP
ncbi:kinase-like domain-containing protein [Pelagophyceae sp. CCMP2097]|nr:kinase-like domain-containing protein [Pelagophyceae sp. CCMP2097]|mmetsp:Transcript_30989/g.107138  ORF Transcript_30989/g.107138 Transcript_30989/m.107138 type:complete len:393 (-) Transcript_30989:66-1244(-)